MSPQRPPSDVPERASTLAELLGRVATQRPDEIALLAPGRPALTYRELAAQVARAQAALSGCGLGREDRVALVLPNGPEAATDGTVVYRSNPDELWSQVAGGDLKTGIWLPPMLPSAFSAAIADGQMLPPKSTRFMPKVMSGLVWADHDARLL